MDDVIPLSQVPAQCRAVNTRVASHKSSDSDNSGSCKDTWLGHTPGELSKLQREDIELGVLFHWKEIEVPCPEAVAQCSLL